MAIKCKECKLVNCIQRRPDGHSTPECPIPQ